jgi:predicted RNA-binding Zn ribbon-like protein
MKKKDKSETSLQESRFHIVANQLAVDLANTEVMDAGVRVDLIEDFEHLVEWLTVAGVLTSQQSSAVLKSFSGSNERRQAVREAKRLRQAIHVLIAAAVSGRQVPGSVFEEINRVLRGGHAYRQLIRNRKGVSLVEESQLSTPLQLLSPVAESAADLLAHGDLAFIRKCENPDCILHIYDTTKNHSRRWCSMSACGNRNKVQAYRRRRIAE